MTGHQNWVFVRPPWRGFAMAPPVTAFAYMAVQALLPALGLADYQGPPDEAYYGQDPVIIAFGFVLLCIVCWTTALVCGLPLIHLLKRWRLLSPWRLMLGAALLGAAALSAEMAAAGSLFGGSAWNRGEAVAWAIAAGAASACFTAFVFRMVAGIEQASHPAPESNL